MKKYFDKLNKKKAIAVASVVTTVTTLASTALAGEDPVVDALTFDFDMTGLGDAIGAAMSSLWTVGRFPVALIVAAALISYMISLFQRFRGASGGKRA